MTTSDQQNVFHYLEEALFNSFIIHCKDGGTKLFFNYMLDVIKAIIEIIEKQMLTSLIYSNQIPWTVLKF